MGVSKVVLSGEVLVDLTGDTVDAAHLAEGYTAHDAAGNPVTGTASGGAAGTGALRLVETNATERVTSTSGRYWVQTGSTYKVRLRKYEVTRGARYRIRASRAMSYATAWFGDEWPALNTYVNYVGLSNTVTEWEVEATGPLMMVSFTSNSAVADSAMTVEAVPA